MLLNILVKKGIAFILLIILGVTLVGCSVFDMGRSDKIHKEMKEYLSQKYGKEFMVERPYRTGSAGFGFAGYRAGAYPKGEPSMKFFVVLEKNATKCIDSYSHILWKSQGEPVIEQLLKEVYGEDILFKYDFMVHDEQREKFTLEHYKLSYSEVLKQYGDHATSYIFGYVFVDKNEDIDKKIEAEKAFRILNKHAINNKVKYYIISIYYMPKTYKQEFIPRLEKAKQDRGDYDYEVLYEENHLFNAIGINEDVKASKAEDLVVRFKY